ncbi:hypothetical protein ACFLRI_02335 [Bacteroidota bacterium]
MKKLLLLFLVSGLLLVVSCTKKASEGEESIPVESTDDALFEQANGKLTPELMWKFGRLGTDIQLSPDKTTLVFGVKKYKLDSNSGRNDIYAIPVSVGEPVCLTSDLGASSFNALWRPDGKKIGFITAGQIWEMDPDGKNKLQVTEIENGVNGFWYAPDMKHIAYISDVKLDETPTEIYPDLPQANVRIIDDLMYRHWNHWHDYAYSHVFIASYEDGKVSEDMDVMENERFDTPMLPWGGMEQINWSPLGDKLAYVCKKKNGKDYALSTNSEIYIFDLTNMSTINMTENGFDGYDHDPVFSPDGNRIVWKSMEEDGFEADKERIFMHDFTTNEFIDLSEGFDQSSSSFSWSEDGSKVYFISGTKATYQIYNVDINTKKITQITTGVHNYQSYVIAENELVA